MIQKKWARVPPQLFTANGDSEGNMQVADTSAFKVQQKVTIFSDERPPLQLEVKRISSNVDMKLGLPKDPIHQGVDLTGFLVTDNARISADEQDRPAIPPDAYNRAVYDEEPTVALRNVLVDKFGNKYTEDNPFPVQLSDGDVNIGTVNAELEVQLTDKDNYPNEGDVHDSIRIGNGSNEADVTSEHELKTFDPQNLAQAEAIQQTIQTESNETQTLLQTEFDATQALIQAESNETQTLLQTEFDETQETLETISDTLVSEFDETQNILQTEFDATQALIQAESNETQTLLQTEFDETQSKLDTLTETVQNESDQTQTLLQTEFDATQALLQAEFNETQIKQDATNTKLDTLISESNETQTLLQTEFDQTQALIQAEFNETQVKQDTTNTKLDTLTSTVQNESDQTQTLLQNEFDATQALLQAEFDATQTLLQNEFDQTQTLLQTELDETQALLRNVVSSGNSTIVNLGAAGVFTGAGEEVLQFGSIVIGIFSNVSGSFKVQWSRDNISWIDDGDTYQVSAGVMKKTSYGPAARYFRVVYTNGATPQSTFFIQTVYHTMHTKPSSHRMGESINSESDAELVKAGITGPKPDGTFGNKTMQGLEPGNCTTVPLGSSGVYRGTWFKWNADYIKLALDVASDQPGIVWVDYSNAVSPINGDDSSITSSVVYAYNPSVQTTFREQVPVQMPWVRIRFQNGATPQSVFVVNTSMLTEDPGLTMLQLHQIPVKGQLAGVVRAIQAVPTPDGSTYQEVPVAPSGDPRVHVSKVQDDILIEPLDSAQASQVVVGTTPVRLDPSPLANRRMISVENEGPVRVALGHSSGITFDTASIRLQVLGNKAFGIDSNLPLWAIAENLGGIQTTLQRSPGSASGTAATPTNVLSSNNTYGVISANAQNINATGFTAGTTNALVSVKIGMEGNKASAAPKVVAFQQHQTGSSDSTTSVSTTSPVTGTSGLFYIAAITRRNSSATVTGVTGLGLTWSLFLSVPNSASSGIIDIWIASGTPTSSSVVTASFNAVSIHNHIAVSSYSNVDLTAPIQTSQTATGTNNIPTTAALAATANGYSYMAAFTANRTMTAGTGYTLRSSELTNDGGNSDSLGVIDKAITVTGSDTPSGTMSGNGAWAAISLALTPAPADNPIVRLSYTLSAVPGATAQNVTLSSGSDVTTLLDITSDRSWVVADIANLEVIATGQAIGTAAANIDYLYVEITDTTGNTARVSIWQGGKAVS